MSDRGRKNDRSQLGHPTVRRAHSQFQTSSFFDPSYVMNIAREAAAAASDVRRLSDLSDKSAIDISRMSVDEYSRSVSLSGSIARSFFDEVGPRDPVSRNREGEPPTAVIDSLVVEFSPLSSVVDGFSATLVFSVTESDAAHISAVRIFRHDHGTDRTPNALSVVGSGFVASQTVRKAGDPMTTYERVQRESGMLGGLSVIQPDGVLGVRRSEPRGELRVMTSRDDITNVISIRNLQGLVPTFKAGLIDQSVSNDPKTVVRLSNTAPVVRPRELVGRAFSPSDVIDRRSLPVQTADNGKDRRFREILSSSPDMLRSRRVGGLVEFSVVDLTVLRGKKYSYYVVLVDSSMREGRRSDIVSTVVDILIPPRSPSVHLVAPDSRQVRIHLDIDDSFFVEKVEVFRRARGLDERSTESVTIGGTSGYTGVTRSTPTSLGWVCIGETPVIRGKASFNDISVRQGMSYDYRVYSVDCFGNKSQTPAEFSATVRSPRTSTELTHLVSFADIDSGTKFARVTTLVTDPRITALFISRRDLTINERAFTSPADPDRPRLSSRDAKRYNTSDPVMFDKRSGWAGFIPVPSTGNIQFIDETVRVDHSYQYRVYGVDAFGRRTPYSISQPVFVSRRPLIDSPTGLTATVQEDGIALRWSPPDIPFSHDDLLGDRSELERSSVRNIYQVQRTEVGRTNWEDFPLVDSTEFFDPIAADPNPSFRPPYPKIGKSYVYRVATLQSGNYYSAFCDPVFVEVSRRPSKPSALTLRASDTRVKPYFVVVGWESHGSIDFWTVDRFEMNNISSQRVRTAEDIESLSYVRVGIVTPESARANSRAVDGNRVRDPSLFVTDRFFIDSDVIVGNTYFYRVTAWIDGYGSDPVHRGIMLSNPAFERRFESLTTDEEREGLLKSMRPMRIISDL